MVGFEFVVTNGSPKRATAAVRSHAVRTGLSQKNKEKSDASGKENSRLTIFRKSSLRGRFKLNNEQKSETKKRGGSSAGNASGSGGGSGIPSQGSSSRAEYSHSQNDGSASVAQDFGAQADAWNEAGAEAVEDVWKDALGERSSTRTETRAEIRAGKEVAAQRSPAYTYAAQQTLKAYREATAPSLVRSPSSPAKPGGHSSCAKKRLHPFISIFLSHMNIHVPSDLVQRKYFGFAMCDPIVLHSALGIAALMWSISLPNPKTAYNESCKQKALAIPSIQEKLHANDISPALVGAIANLAQMETIEKNYPAARVHMQAIDIIAQRQGGYGAWTKDPELATSLNWTDLLLALMENKKPSIMLLTNIEDVPIPESVKQRAWSPSVCHMRVFEDTPYDSTLRWTVASARVALYALKDNVGILNMRILCNNLDQRLTMLLQTIHKSSKSYPLLLAVQLFSCLVIRETEVRCIVVETVVARLMDAIRPLITCTSAPSEEHMSGIIWCIWIGLVATVPHSDNWEWFSQRLKYLVPKTGIVDGAQFRMVMQRYLWDDIRCERALSDHGTVFLWQNSHQQIANAPAGVSREQNADRV